ncbi:TolC family protein [Kordiimonas aquimaris]|uniref:TolC family protein n=1 Tax=Kordiimonas aquimaris TaxID=707591 RepID=UPI0021CFB949|nr:TolC family protein [Kordiimonas aquimaris]
MKFSFKLLIGLATIMGTPLTAIGQSSSLEDEPLSLVPVVEETYQAPAASKKLMFSMLRANGIGTTLEDVLHSVDVHAPQIIQLQSDIIIAEANELSASSGFDPVIAARYSGRLTGFYGGQVGDVEVQQRLSGLNAEVYGGYSISQGRLPVYEDQYLTNNDGEFRAGASIELLRGRTIDPVRLRLSNARLKVNEVVQSAQSETINIKSDAATAFVNWLYAEQIRDVYFELFRIAEMRVEDIEKSIAAGQLAEITRDENQQLLLTRQSQLLKAEQIVLEQKARLGFFLRDDDGATKMPVVGANSMVPQNDPYHSVPVAELVQRIHESRPDIVALQLDMQQLLAEQRLAENDQQPDLTFNYEVRRDFGRGDEIRAGTDHKVGLALRVPLQFAQARGQIAAARAKIKALKAEIRIREERAELALHANQQALTITEQQLVIGASEIKVAETLQVAEQSRYLQGASDVFRLNAQETALANSKFRLLQAQRDHDTLLIEYYRITGQFWF